MRHTAADRAMKGMLEIYVVHPHHIVNVIVNRSYDVMQFVRIIDDAIYQMQRKKPSALCLFCDNQFGRRNPLPRAFLIAIPMMWNDSQDVAAGICSGVCAECCDDKNDEEIARRALRMFKLDECQTGTA
jgi:hypothetical protein